MDEVNLTEVINSVGFPIACCIALFWLVQKTLTKQTEMMADLKSATERNTDTMNALIQLLRRGDK